MSLLKTTEGLLYEIGVLLAKSENENDETLQDVAQSIFTSIINNTNPKMKPKIEHGYTAEMKNQMKTSNRFNDAYNSLLTG